MRTLLTLAVLMLLPSWLMAADVAALIKNLGSSDNEVRRDAAKQLSELGKDARPASTALVKALKDSDRFVRRFSAQALGNIGPDAKDAISALAVLLQDDNAQVREAGIKALGKMGKSAIPALTKALSGTTSDVQESAISALAATGADGAPALIAAVGDVKMDASLRRKAIEVLLPLGTAANKAIPTLVEAVKNPKARGMDARQLRLDAVAALGSLGKMSDKEVVSLLDGMVKDEALTDMQLKNAARAALKRVQGRK